MLKDTLQEDLKKAMLGKDELRKSVLRLLISAINYYEIQKGGAGYNATEDDIIYVISKEIKKRKESIEAYTSAGRKDAAEKEQEEIKILEEYFPKQMTEDEVEEIVEKAIEKTGASSMTDIGKVMQKIMPDLKGKADGSIISQIVKDKLTQ